MIYFVVFHGNRGGDWWSIIDQTGKMHNGVQYLRELRTRGIKLHRKTPPVEIPGAVKYLARWGSLYWYEQIERRIADSV